MNWPRFTGEVRAGVEVTARTDPCVSTPPRGLSLGSVTLRISEPSTPGNPVVLGQPGVEERVVAVDPFQDAAVLAGHVLEGHLGLAAHRPADVAGSGRCARCRPP